MRVLNEILFRVMNDTAAYTIAQRIIDIISLIDSDSMSNF